MDNISFIVINRNNQKFINRCIYSINKISYPNKEIIIVDDASSDNSIKSLKAISDKIILNRYRKGIAQSRNIGIKIARSDLAFIIDSDIVIKKINILKIIKAFNSHPLLVGISGQYYSKGKGNLNRILDLRRKYIYRNAKDSYIYNLNNNYTTFSGGFCVLKKSILNKLKQFGKNEVSGQDILFQLRLLNLGFEFGYDSEMVGIHLHQRGYKSLFKKLFREVQGNIFLVKACFKRKLTFPPQESLFSFPILLLIGLISKSIYIILLEFLPYIIILIKITDLKALQLFFYQLFYNLLLIPLYFSEILLKQDTSITTKVAIIFAMTFKSVLGKFQIVNILLFKKDFVEKTTL